MENRFVFRSVSADTRPKTAYEISYTSLNREASSSPRVNSDKNQRKERRRANIDVYCVECSIFGPRVNF